MHRQLLLLFVAVAGCTATPHPYHAPIGASAGTRIGGSPRGPERLRFHQPEMQHAIDHGLEWLRRHENTAGSWGPMTSFVLLAFLAHGSTTRSGPYRRQVAAAVRALERSTPSGGEGVAVTAWAMAEAAVLSQDEAVTAIARPMLRRLVIEHRPDGSWREPGGTGLWAHRLANMALSAGKELGCVSSEVVATSAEWIQNRKPKSFAPSLDVACWLWHTESRHDLYEFTGSVGGYEWIAKGRAANHVRSEFLFPATRAMYRCGRSFWERWRDSTLRALVTAQVQNGPDEGSWAGWQARHETVDRLRATVMAVLALESAYIYEALGR